MLVSLFKNKTKIEKNPDQFKIHPLTVGVKGVKIKGW